MPEEAWGKPVRNGQGRTVPAREIPWMRAKELWVHGAHLDANVTFADMPAGALDTLVDDALAIFAARDQTPDATLVATDVDRTRGSGPVRVEGPVAAIAAWLTRSRRDGLTGEVPELPAWR